jgi:vitamin B12 transporter
MFVRSTMSLRFPFATSLSLLAVAVQAQTTQLDAVVTTAARTPQRLAEVLADVSVISRDDIERLPAASLGDLLRQQGAVQLTRNGGPAGVTSLYLRGADNRHSLLLIDGMRVDSQATGGPSWQAIPLDQIDHIEIVKGPASSLYGSDAVGGVIQVFTRKAGAQPQLSLGAGAGNLGTRRLDANSSARFGAFDIAAGLSTERSDGFNATLNVPNNFSYAPDRDGYRKHSAQLRAGLAVAESQRVELTALRSHTNAQFDAGDPTTDDRSTQDGDSTRLAWTARWSPALDTELSHGESRDRYEQSPSPYLTNTRERQTQFNAFWKPDASQQLQLLTERLEQRLESTSEWSPPLNDQRTQTGLGAGWLYHQGGLDAQLHARRDHDSQFGSVTTGNLAGGFALAPQWRVTGSWGNAFHAPTLYQRGSEYGPIPGKGPTLEAERARNAELALRWSAGQSEASLTAYHARVSNLIVFGLPGSCASPYGCYQNVASATLKGLTLRGDTSVGSLHLAASADWQDPTDASTGKRLARRAKQLATLRADLPVGDWSFATAVQAQGASWDNAANTRKLGGFALVDFDAQYRLSRDLKLQLNLQNAFDRDHVTAYGYASMPRQAFVGLRWTAL